MADLRLQLLTQWLEQHFNQRNLTINSASFDASFRRYFRVEHKNQQFIVMDAPPELEGCQDFIRIDAHLIAGGIHAPKIINMDLARGFLLLEDFGNQTFLMAQQSSFSLKLYQTAIDILLKIQAVETKSISLHRYQNAQLNQEMQLLLDWYLPKTLSDSHKIQLKKLMRLLCESARASNQVFVHRDYHSRNLMVLPNQGLGVLDFQDAIIGSQTYDLVSLLKDAYFILEPVQLKTLLVYYYERAETGKSFAQFERQFDFMGVQRHLKILGIFTRLSRRDHKPEYLQHIPQVRRYIIEMAQKYTELTLFNDILNHENL